jgi:hypothetical protein
MSLVVYKDIGIEFEKRAAIAKDIFIVSPFIKSFALRQLLSTSEARLTVITRWRLEELCSGVSDLDVFNEVCNRGGKLFLCNNLHAKYFRFDSSSYAGSANLTSNGLGYAAHSNLELVSSLTSRLEKFESFVLKKSFEASQEDYEFFNQQVELFAKEDSFIDPASPDNECLIEDWIPRFRSPEHLYDCYRNVVESISARGREEANRDLKYLALPKKLTREDFYSHVASRLQLSNTFREIDQFVGKETKRFGEMTTFLKRLFPDMSHKSAQHEWQTLFRWLLEFQSEKYIKSRNPYTELITKVDKSGMRGPV